MRKTVVTDHLQVRAIAGTYVVFLGFSLPRNMCPGLLGFSIHRNDKTDNESYYLKGMKCFDATNPGLPSGSQYSSQNQPIQSFQWADYSAKPAHEYDYTITALKGGPEKLVEYKRVTVTVITESPETGFHDIYFNRGIAASQEYIRRFGNKRPGDVPNNKAFEWLSRGAYEALTDFVNTCQPGVHSLKIAAYEFVYEPFIELIKLKQEEGVTIQIVYDARKDYPKVENRKLVEKHGLVNCFERTTPKSYISHNKFIVKLENEKPASIWTGGMNFSDGGIFGHSNVAHVVQDNKVAELYNSYWDYLSKDPGSRELKKSIESLTGLPPELPMGTTVLFSPRGSLSALEFYSKLAQQAEKSLFMTFAFGINNSFKNVYRTSQADLRFALLEKKTRPMKPGPAKDKEENEIQQLRNMPENIFSIGNFIKTNKFDGWVKERLTNLNSNVRYIHNKFMIVDALEETPVIICGSANFSEASTVKNDENMLIIKGNKRVADIYFGEFMRLFSHYSFRESLQWKKLNDPPKYLKTDDWWKDYFGKTDRSARRKYFSAVNY